MHTLRIYGNTVIINEYLKDLKKKKTYTLSKQLIQSEKQGHSKKKTSQNKKKFISYFHKKNIHSYSIF